MMIVKANNASAYNENKLCEQLLYLKLSAFLQQYDDAAKLAAKHKWTYPHYLEQLVEAEVKTRTDRSIQRRIKLARFPVIKTLDAFDFESQKNSPLIFQLNSHFSPHDSSTDFHWT
jgi:DNA replication protein DnaC